MMFQSTSIYFTIYIDKHIWLQPSLSLAIEHRLKAKSHYPVKWRDAKGRFLSGQGGERGAYTHCHLPELTLRCL